MGIALLSGWLISPSLYAKNLKKSAGVGIAVGGTAKAPSFSMEYDFFTTNRRYNYMVGGGLDLIFNNDRIPGDIADYPVPHNSFVFVGVKQPQIEIGLYGKYGIETARNSGVFVYALGGISFAEKILLSRSTVTGWYYTEEKLTVSYGMFGGGIAYFPVRQQYSLQAGYDNRTGVNLGLGYQW